MRLIPPSSHGDGSVAKPNTTAAEAERGAGGSVWLLWQHEKLGKRHADLGNLEGM